MAALRNLPGGVPDPEDLVGRDHLLDVLWQQLERSNVLLVAPRRFGKTGVMRHVLKRPRDGWLPVYLDVENTNSPDEFAAELLHALLEHDNLRKLMTTLKRLPTRFLDFVSERIDEIDVEGFKVKLKEALGDSWTTVAKALVLQMEKADDRIVFILDEFPQLVENVTSHGDEEGAKSFLKWFRSLRMRQKDELRRFRFVLAGSTGVDIILRRLGVSDKLNDFFRLPVEPLSRSHAEQLLRGVADGCTLKFTPAAADKLLDLIGPPVPYFIHLFVSQILIEERLKGKSLTPEDVEDVYTRRVLGPSCRGYFEYYRQRLERYGKTGRPAAIAILKAVAEAPGERVSDSVLYEVYRKTRKKGASELQYREIMADLECDWYVVLDTRTNEYYFLVDVMKDWWKRFYRSVGPVRPRRA